MLLWETQNESCIACPGQVNRLSTLLSCSLNYQRSCNTHTPFIPSASNPELIEVFKLISYEHSINQICFLLSSFAVGVCDRFTQRTAVNFDDNDTISGGAAADDYATCCAICKRTNNCTAFSYSVPQKRCYPKR